MIAERRRRRSFAFEWAALFGTQPGAVRVTLQKPGIRRIDTTLTHDQRELLPLRILRLPEQVDPFPAPGGRTCSRVERRRSVPTFLYFARIRRAGRRALMV